MSLSNTKGFYRSKDGQHYFTFYFIPEGDHLVIYCLDKPSLDGPDPSPMKTHIFDSGKICFVEGHEPRDQARAEQLAVQWAEYFLEYRRTGIAQN